jgi:hypothetical protein
MTNCRFTQADQLSHPVKAGTFHSIRQYLITGEPELHIGVENNSFTV